MTQSVRQDAPGALEQVRVLLNSWGIPNDTRKPTDTFDDFVATEHLPAGEIHGVRALRDDLRKVIEGAHASDEILNRWIARCDVQVIVENGELRPRASDESTIGSILEIVLQATMKNQWHRLKACPDCRWVFYDHSRNGSKRWCLMNAASPNGRGCGTIAKVRRYRERHPTQPRPNS